MTVTELTPAQTIQFEKATQGVYAKWTEQIGLELVKMAEKAVASTR